MADPQMGKFVRLRPQAGLDVAQTFALCELSESHTPELLGTPECLDFVLTVITPHATPERMPGQLFHEL